MSERLKRFLFGVTLCLTISSASADMQQEQWCKVLAGNTFNIMEAIHENVDSNVIYDHFIGGQSNRLMKSFMKTVVDDAYARRDLTSNEFVQYRMYRCPADWSAVASLNSRY